MNLKDILDEVKVRGEKVKDEIVDEIVHSKTLNQLVNNENFIKTVGKIIETKDEVRKIIRDQVNNVFQALDIPSHDVIESIDSKIDQIERAIEKIGSDKIPVTRIKRSAAGSKGGKKSSPKKATKKKPAKKKSPAKKKAAKKTSAKKTSAKKKTSTKKKSSTKKKTSAAKKKTSSRKKK